MGKCSSCGLDLPGSEEMCRQCYLAKYETLTASKDSSSYSGSAYMLLPLWLFMSYALLTYIPSLARAIVLGAAFFVILCLHFWALSQKPRKSYNSPPELLSFILCLCCGVVWKITGGDVWFRLCGACVLVSSGYKVFYRATDLAKAARR